MFRSCDDTVKKGAVVKTILVIVMTICNGLLVIGADANDASKLLKIIDFRMRFLL